jgi:hypothetical protein
MLPVYDQSGETIAYVYQNIIVDTERQEVLGLILGNCVYGREESPAGKLFRNTFRKPNGKMVARLGDEISLVTPPDEAAVLRQAWQILSRMREHTCIWIEEKDSWSPQSFYAYLSVPEPEFA